MKKDTYTVRFSPENKTWQVWRNNNHLVTDFSEEENANKAKDLLETNEEIRWMDAHQTTAAAGQKTPSPMPEFYYLKPGNIINEPKYNRSFTLEGFDKDGVFYRAASEFAKVSPKDHSRFSAFALMMDEKKLVVVDHPYETDRDKILLENEIAMIQRMEEIKGLVEGKSEAEQTAAAAEEHAAATEAAHEAHKAATEDTIGGMEAMAASGARAPEGVRQGGLSDAVFNTHSVQNYGSGFGWVGHELRTDALDKFTEKTFKKLGMSDREIGAFVTSRIGRKWGDSISFGKADATKGAPGIKKWFFDENGHNMDDYEQSMAGGKGQGIPNNYEGKSPWEIWEAYTPEQRINFIEDHFKGDDAVVPQGFGNAKWEYMGDAIKKTFTDHVNSGQYSGGKSPRTHGSLSAEHYNKYQETGDKKHLVASNKYAKSPRIRYASKKQKKMMKQYAKMCGYDSVPKTWTPMDYTEKGWKKLLKGGTPKASGGNKTQWQKEMDSEIGKTIDAFVREWGEKGKMPSEAQLKKMSDNTKYENEGGRMSVAALKQAIKNSQEAHKNG